MRKDVGGDMMNKLICVLTVILYVGSAANSGFAQDSVKTELKEVATPSPFTEPTITPEPPFELDSKTEAEIVKRLVNKFNITSDEVKISTAAKTHEEGRIFLYTNLGTFTYKGGEIYPAGLKLEAEINETLADDIIKEELKKKGIVTEPTIFYNSEGRTVKLCELQYDENATDFNFYPTVYGCEFNFDNSKGETAVYEIWIALINPTSGEIIKLEKKGEKIFNGIKTPEEAAVVIRNNKNILVDPSKIILSYRGEPAWIYRYLPKEGLWLYVYDNSTVEEIRMPILFGSAPPSPSTNTTFGSAPPSPSTNTTSKIFGFSGLLVVVLLTTGYLLMKLKKEGG